MGIKYGTEEWVKAVAQDCNESQAYKEAAKDWEGDMYFVIEPEGDFEEKIIMYFDLWHGECRGASIIADENEKNPAYRFWAPYGIWKKILMGELDSVQAMMSGKLNLKGDMSQIMKMPNAAVEFTNCMIRVDTEFPV
jgi:putative sterol carrier protein